MSGKYALIIGNTEYIDSGLAQLSAPGKDAEDFAQVLKDQEIGAFDSVNILLNQSSAAVTEAIDEFFDQKKQDDLLVLYFSGHGVRDELGALYLAVKNTIRSRLRSTAVKSDFIREAMDQCRSKRQVLILDCCNSGAFAQGTKAATGGSIGTATAFESGFGRIILTASDSTQFAWEGDRVIGETDNSLFTHYLVEGLKGDADNDGDGRITVDELYDYAYEKVRRATPKQTPSKFSTKQQGEIVLRQSTRIEDIKPIPLPDDLLTAAKSSLPYVREAAVKQLDELLKGKNRGLARSAKEALEHIAENDDSKTISRAAFQALEAIRQAEQAALQKAEEERLSKLEAERIAEEERRVREQAEAERKAKVDAERLAAAQKAEEERIAKAKLEAERLAEEKRLADEAEKERKAKAEAKRLADEKTEAERLAAQKAKEERIAKAKLEAERLADEKAEAEQLVIEKTASLPTSEQAEKVLLTPRDKPSLQQMPQGQRGILKWILLGAIGLGAGIWGISYLTNNLSSPATATKTPFATEHPATEESFVTEPPEEAPSTLVALGSGTGRIAFGSTRDNRISEIYTMNADGSELIRLTNNGTTDFLPSWSPDGRFIAFISTRDGNHEIYIMNADGSDQTRLTNNPTFDLSPAWSPDGQHIIFTSTRDNGDFHIFIMKSDGSEQTRLTNNPATTPTWSPDGQHIAFANADGNNFEICTMKTDGSAIACLTNSEGSQILNTSPAWSPDGQRIIFTSTRNGNLEIYIMNADGSEQTRLTNNTVDDKYPVWIDNQRISFMSAQSGDMEIYAMNIDGSEQARLTFFTDQDSYPTWQIP